MNPELALGFAVESEPWHLLSYLFPDKIGGRPAWLALNNLPTTKDLSCPICSDPMCFLMQIYSPIPDREDCFHRFLFVFMCRKGSCHSTSSHTPFVVFRSQLARKNPYYSYEPPETEYPTEQHTKSLALQNRIPWAGQYGSLCPVCGCRADKACAKCKQIRYCSKKHQILDWKKHKPKCGPESSGSSTLDLGILNSDTNDFLLPEYRLCSESVEDQSANVVDCSDDDEEDDADTIPNPDAGGGDDDDDATVLSSIAKRETKEEALFRRLKEAMSSEPDQVVRFQRGGRPLWLSLEPPTIPNCEVCGARRCFEFQVTPQLLHYLKLDKVNEKSPDFGSLYIFTCSKSCPLPRQEPASPQSLSQTVEYQRECVIRQFVP